MDRDRLRQLFIDAGLSRVADAVDVLLQPSIRLATVPAPDTVLPIGSSKIGGLPDLPIGHEWPVRNGTPLSFIGQLHMEDLAPYDDEHVLPPTGLLSFFYDSKEQRWGFDPKDKDAWRVYYFTAPLVRRSPQPRGEQSDVFGSCMVTFANEMTLPKADSLDIDKLDLTQPSRSTQPNESAWERYWDVWGLFLEDSESGNQEHTSRYRVLGHPDQIQGAMQVECQLASNGIYVGTAAGYQDPRAPELRKTASDWRLLLQVDSDEENTGMMWGDAGRLYFWIRDEDLRNRNFSRVWLILQCG